jgi:uncharacterized membrane protein YagU involved in acid resistance
MTQVLPHPRTIIGAIIAGMVAGVTILVCFAVLMPALAPDRNFSLAGTFTFDASVLLGKAAYASDASVALGAALHFLVAIGWAVGYAFVAERQPQLVTRPLISGAGFGLIVYFAMQLVIVAANLYRIPTPRELGVALLAHLVFYGMPVAFIVARLRLPR